MSNFFRYLPFGGFFFVWQVRVRSAFGAAAKGSVAHGQRSACECVFFMVSACGVAVSLSVPMILQRKDYTVAFSSAFLRW
ncbi:MAG: hypothetical protein Ct9H300mP14_10040 [Gammaproteobacteria bacterium]|nr:MAG: hypothetical protein Ct9H300mP14_10040 [Gammaproteobacteria bacterium]